MKPVGPAIWYDANGRDWGFIGPNGEHLDQNGEERAWTSEGADVPRWLWVLLAIGVSVVVVAMGVLLALLPQGTNSRGPGGIDTRPVVTPAPYGPPDAEPRTRPRGSLPVVISTP